MPATTSILMMLAEASGATACRMRRNGTSLLAANIRHHLEMEHCHCGPMCHGATASFSSQTTIRSSQETLRHSSRSEEHTSELQSLMRISSAVFCLKKKKNRPPESHKQRNNTQNRYH